MFRNNMLTMLLAASVPALVAGQASTTTLGYQLISAVCTDNSPNQGNADLIKNLWVSVFDQLLIYCPDCSKIADEGGKPTTSDIGWVDGTLPKGDGSKLKIINESMTMMIILILILKFMNHFQISPCQLFQK